MLTETEAPPEHRMVFRGPVAAFLADLTRHIDLEGAIRSGKTTAALVKVLASCLAHPGIHWLICRYSDDDTKTKLKPVWERLCLEAGVPMQWHPEGKYYELANGAWVYAFGLKAQDLTMRYSKFRGVTLAGIYNDQTEELPYDVYEELTGRLSQVGYPQQILLTPNPPDENHWLSMRYPEDNHVAGHRYYRVSVYDNAHNLAPETLEGLDMAYPVGHAKHGPMLLGTRGVNVIGQPVYGALDPRQPETAAFQRARHERVIALDPTLPLYEAIDFGKHHPCVVWMQYTPWGGLRVLGGILGQHLYLEDFAPMVQQYRQRWFPDALDVASCCDPAGSHDNSQGVRANGVQLLRDLGFAVRYKVDSNTPDVRLTMIERLAGHMRRRDPHGEAFQVSRERWLRISSTSVVVHPFVADALQAGYVWDAHYVSVGNKQMRKPKKDGWFEHGMNCFSADTDVLTRRGWLPFQDVVESDALATVDLHTDTLEYQASSRLIQQEHDGPLIHFGGKLDALVTEAHRMVVAPWTGDWAVRQPTVRVASEVRHTDRVKLTAAHWEGTQASVVTLDGTRSTPVREIDPGDWAEFLGWYIAEGSANSCVKCPGHGYQVVISQQPGYKRVLLEALLARLPWRWYSRSAGVQASSQQLWMAVTPLGRSDTKRVPAWIKEATPEMIRRFLIGAVLGDGTVTPHGQQGYFTVSRGLADDIQELWLKLGRAVSLTRREARPYCIRGRRGTNTRPQYHVWERSSTWACVRRGDGASCITRRPYRGMVYCASVPNGTLIVRRSGVAFVAGNCLEYGEHNFGGVQPTIEQSMRRAARVRSAEGRRVERQLPVDDMTRKYDRLVRTRAAGGRGGY